MRTRRSRRLAAWDFAWLHVAGIAGIGDEPTAAQARLRELLGSLYSTPLPALAIEQMALAIYEAWAIGRQSGAKQT